MPVPRRSLCEFLEDAKGVAFMTCLEGYGARGLDLLRLVWRCPLVRYLCYVALGIWALAADPFTLSSTSDQALSREYHNLHVRLAGVDPAPLTVVMLDAQSILELHAGGHGWMSSNDWPLDYADHARLMTDLIANQPYPPSALFYDIFFEAPRSASGDLGRLGSRLSRLTQGKNSTAVILAGGGTPMPISLSSYELLEKPRLAPTAWSGHGDDYPFTASILFQYSEKVDTGTTPAVAMYQALCEASNRDCDWLVPAEAPDLSLQWAAREAQQCVSEELYDRALTLLWRFGQGVLQGLFSMIKPSPLPPECLPVNLVRASTLYGNDPVSLVPPGLEEGLPYVVMVGVVMPSTLDYVATPIYEQLSGVMLHAIAFENLWRLESGYFHYRDATPLGIAAWCLAVLLFMCQAQKYRGSPPRARVLLTLFWWFVIALVVLLVQLIFHNLLRIVPEGWLSLIAIVPLLREIVLRNEAAIYQVKETNNE